MARVSLVLLILFLLVAVGAAIAVWTNVLTSQSSTNSGRAVGTILVYEVDLERNPGNKPVDMDALARAVGRRIDFTCEGVASVEALNDRQIQVNVFDNDPAIVQRVERILASAGTLEFRILANRLDADHSRLIEDSLDKSKQDDTERVLDADGNEIGRWIPIKKGTTAKDHKRVSILLRDTQYNVIRTTGEDDRSVDEILVFKDEWNVTGEFLDGARPDRDQKTGDFCPSFFLNPAGAALFSELTRAHVPDMDRGLSWKLGIILNGFLYSAPTLQSMISNRGQISGGFGRQEVADLANVLNAGALPAPIRQVEKRTVGERIGI